MTQFEVPELMRAATIVEPGKIEITEVPLPRPSESQVLIRLEGCGICASNLPVWEGRPWFSYPQQPGAPGHEGWGTIVAIGENVTGIDLGTRVTMLSGNAYAEYDVASMDSIVPLPPALLGKPFPGEPLGCAQNIVDRADIQSGQTVAVIGIGFMGALVTSLAQGLGARVHAISRRAFACNLASSLGAEQVYSIQEGHLDAVRKTLGEKCDRVIEAAGMQWALDLGSDLIKIRGKLIIAGYHQDGLRNVNMQQWNWRGIDVINAHERENRIYVRGIRTAVEAVASGIFNPYPLLTNSYRLDQLDTAFSTALSRPDGFFKGIVVCH